MEKQGVLSTELSRIRFINSRQPELQSPDTYNLVGNMHVYLRFCEFSTISTGVTTTTNLKYLINQIKSVIKGVNKPEVPLYLL